MSEQDPGIRAEKAEAECKRLREKLALCVRVGVIQRVALEEIASTQQPLDFDDMGCARKALGETAPQLKPAA